MEKRVLTVKNPSGLHARPAAALSRMAKKYPCTVKIIARDKNINAKSIVSILAAGIVRGTEIAIETEGEAEGEAMEELETFIRSGCGESAS